MSSSRDAKARQARYEAALTRPELRWPNDGFTRVAPTGATSAPVKARDPEEQRLIDEALRRERR